MSFEELPVELKTMIFSNFTAKELISIVMPVSTVWKNIALQPILWQVLEFNGKEHYYQSPKDLVEIINRYPVAKCIRFNNITNMNLNSSLNTNNSIRKLKFHLTRFSFNEFALLVDKCPNVVSVNIRDGGLGFVTYIEGVAMARYDIDMKMIQKMTEWKNLKSVKIEMAQSLSDHDSCLIEIAKKCEKIEKIRLEDFCTISERSFRVLMEKRARQLKLLDIYTWTLQSEDYELFDKCVSLEKLFLFEARHMTKLHFEKLKKLPKLKLLECHRCKAIGKTFLNFRK